MVPDELLAASFLSYLGSRVPIYIKKPRQSLVSAAYGPHSSHILKKGLLLLPPPVQPNLTVCFISALLASHFPSSESAKERRLGFSHAKSFLKD